MGYRDYPSWRSTSDHRSRRDDNGRDARERTRSRDTNRTERRSCYRSRDDHRRTHRRSRSPSRDDHRRTHRRSPTPPRRTHRCSPSPYGDAHSRSARRSPSRPRRSNRHGSSIEGRTALQAAEKGVLEDIVRAMERQTRDPEEEPFIRLEATHIAANTPGNAGTSFVPIAVNGSSYFVPASTSHTAPNNSRWAARSAQTQTILTHCIGKHNPITVPAGVDDTGNPADRSGRNAARGQSNTGDSNYPDLPRGGRTQDEQQPRMTPVAIPNGGRASTSYAASAARGAESSAQTDQGPTDPVERVEWLIKTTEIDHGPRPVPASFGQGWQSRTQVYGKKMGLNERCRPGVCIHVFGYRGRVCPDGRECENEHTWLKDDAVRAIIANPLPENGGARTGIAWLRQAVQNFVANKRRGFVDEDHKVPIPPLPGRFLTLPQYENMRQKQRSRHQQQQVYEDGHQTGNTGEMAEYDVEEGETTNVEDPSRNNGQETASTTGRQDRRPRNGIRGPPVTSRVAANSRAFNPNASQINNSNLAYFAARSVLGGPWGGNFENTLRQGDRALKAEIAAREDAAEESGNAPRSVSNQTYIDPHTGQRIKEEIEEARWRRHPRVKQEEEDVEERRSE